MKLLDWCLTWLCTTHALGVRGRWQYDRFGFALTSAERKAHARQLPSVIRSQHKLEMLKIVLECERLIELGVVDSVAAEIAGSPLEAVLIQRLWSALRQLGR